MWSPNGVRRPATARLPRLIRVCIIILIALALILNLKPKYYREGLDEGKTGSPAG